MVLVFIFPNLVQSSITLSNSGQLGHYHRARSLKYELIHTSHIFVRVIILKNVVGYCFRFSEQAKTNKTDSVNERQVENASELQQGNH